MLQHILSKDLVELAILHDYRRPQIHCIALGPYWKMPKFEVNFHRNLSVSFSMKNKSLGAHFLFQYFFFVISILKSLMTNFVRPFE